VLATFMLLTAYGQSRAQSVPTATLSAPDATFGTSFVNVSAVREISDGRLLVLDTGDGKVFLLDAAWTVGRQVGRNGNGPGEYASPVRLFAIAGDSSAVRDWGNSRLLIIAPGGDAAGTMPDRQPPACRGHAFQFGSYAAADTLGRWYTASTPAHYSSAGAPRPADSAAIVRWSAGCRADTIAYVPNPWGKDHTVVFPNGLVTSDPSWSQPPYDAQTAWAVSPDGRLAIVRPDPYRIDLLDANGRRRDGRPIAHERVRVDDVVKQAWREERGAPRPMLTMTRDGRSSMTMGKGRPVREPARWPAFLPPFLQDFGDFQQSRSAVRFAPNGMVWIKRTVPLDQPPFYDVIDQLGQLVLRVRLRARSHVAGFGRTSVVVVRRGEDDLEYLERYRLPPF
jgi:hypothetical protein